MGNCAVPHRFYGLLQFTRCLYLADVITTRKKQAQVFIIEADNICKVIFARAVASPSTLQHQTLNASSIVNIKQHRAQTAKFTISRQKLPYVSICGMRNSLQDLLGTRGKATEVVAMSNARIISDAAATLDQGKVLQIAPPIALLKPIASFRGPATPPFFPAVLLIVALPARDALLRLANTDLSQQDRVEQLQVVVLYAQDVIGVALANLTGDGHHLFRNDPTASLLKRLFEAIQFQCGDDVLEGAWRGDVIVKGQKAVQPRQLNALPLTDVLEIICTAEYHADLNGQHLAQSVR